MTVLSKADATPTLDWHSIPWDTCYPEVRKLQARIAKATREGRWRKVKALQWLLTHSFYAKALAVRRVTENQGKRTAGLYIDLAKYPSESRCSLTRVTTQNRERSRNLFRVREGLSKPYGRGSYRNIEGWDYSRKTSTESG